MLDNNATYEQLSAIPLATAATAAVAKKKKYSEMSLLQGAEFIPFAMETYGGVHPSYWQLIKEIGTFAVDHESAWGKRDIIDHCLQATAIAVQTGNARAAITGSMTYRTGGNSSAGTTRKYMDKGREKWTPTFPDRC
jgi:hypothetical protein